MSDTIALTGIVATIPRHLVTEQKLQITSFRLASTQRRYNRTQQAWVDGETNWYTITVFRQLAVNAAGSLNKGDRVVINGRLRIRNWVSGEKNGITVEVEADSIGHDLLWGTTAFTRSVTSSLASQTPENEDFPPETATSGDSDDESSSVLVDNGQDDAEAIITPLVPVGEDRGPF